MPILGVIASGISGNLISVAASQVNGILTNADYSTTGTMVGTSGYVATTTDGAASSAVLVMKINETSTPSITWQKLLGSAASTLYQTSLVVDSSENVYVFARRNETYVYAKWNSAGTLVWEKNLSGYSMYIGAATISSSDAIYCGGGGGLSGGTGLMVKLDTSGAVTWATSMSIDQYSMGCQAYKGTNLWQGGYATGGYKGWIGKFNDSSGANTWATYYYSGEGTTFPFYEDNSNAVYASGMAFEGSYVTANRNSGVVKFNTSGTWQWYTGLNVASVGLNYNGQAADATGANFYQVGANYVWKINSSGTLQWQRKFTGASAVILRSVQVVGTKLFITGSIAGATATFVIPTDGSGPATFVFNGVTISYEAGTGTTITTNYTQSGFGQSFTAITPTVNTGSLGTSTASYSLTSNIWTGY